VKRLLLAAAAVLLSAAPAWSAPAIWRVRDADTTVTLFGSMHALPPGAQWRTPELDRAIAEADEVWFEFPSPKAPGMAEAYARAYAARPKQAEPTSQLLSAEGLKLAIAAFGSKETVDARTVPDLLLDMTRRYWEKAGLDGRHGVETTIQGLVPPEKQRAFADPQQHLALVASGSIEQQVRQLEGFLRSPLDPAPLKATTEAWLRGDAAALEREAVARMKTREPGYARVFLEERNRTWIDPIAKMMDRPGRVLVVVGAAHMAGPEGLPALLRARGYRVDGPRGLSPARSGA
jgi:uncharacterized protein YbaP (TraB family)